MDTGRNTKYTKLKSCDGSDRQKSYTILHYEMMLDLTPSIIDGFFQWP